MLAPLEAIDVVGLDSNKHGRSCTHHDICGRAVEVGDILFTRCELEVDYLSSEGEESCFNDPNVELFEELFDNAIEKVKVYKVGADGMANCHVGYLPKYLFYHFKGAYTFDKLYLRVMVDYRHSETDMNAHVAQRTMLPLPPPVVRKTKTRRRDRSANDSNQQTTGKTTAPRKIKRKQQNVITSNSKKKRRNSLVATKAAKRVATNTTINDSDTDSSVGEKNQMNDARNAAKRAAMIRAITDSDSDSNGKQQTKKYYDANESIAATMLSSKSLMNTGNNSQITTSMIDLSNLALTTERQSEQHNKETTDHNESPYL